MSPPQTTPPTLTAAQLQARALAGARRAAMLRRIRRIRRSVVALAAALFSAAFLAIYVQLASGHDPALVAAARRAAATGNTSATGASSTGGSSGSTEATSNTSSGEESTIGSSGSTGGESTGATSAVTCSQS